LCARSTPSQLRRRRPVDMWTTKARCPHTHRIKKQQKVSVNFDCFESTAVRSGPSQPRPSARAAATPVAAFGIYPGRHSHKIAKYAISCGGKVVVASRNHSHQASPKSHVQSVRSSFPHYKWVFYRIGEERNFVRRKGSFGFQEPFPAGFIQDPFPACTKCAPARSKLVFYRI
jgi:hypothetical protein